MNKKQRRSLIERNLRKKYQALFLNEFKYNGLEYGVASYFMKKLLHTGRIAAFNLDVNKELDAMLAFGSFNEEKYDWKGDPIYVRILNEYGANHIPKKPLLNNEEAVLLKLDFIPQTYISEYVERLIDIEETIRTNLTVNKMPFIIKSTDAKTINAIKSLLNNEEVIWTADNMFDVLNTNVPYIIDKLSLYKTEVEGELLSILGIDNVKFEKKAQMTRDEVNTNDDEIDAYRKIIRQKIEAFFEQINNVLGHSISIEKDMDEMDTQEYEEGDEEYEEV